MGGPSLSWKTDGKMVYRKSEGRGMGNGRPLLPAAGRPANFPGQNLNEHEEALYVVQRALAPDNE